MKAILTKYSSVRHLEKPGSGSYVHLLAFLEVDDTKSFFVKQTLGYDLEEFKELIDAELKAAFSRPDQTTQSVEVAIIDDKEKVALLSVIELSMDVSEPGSLVRSFIHFMLLDSL